MRLATAGWRGWPSSEWAAVRLLQHSVGLDFTAGDGSIVLTQLAAISPKACAAGIFP